MTQTAWQQWKHNWITFAVTAIFAITGYYANKFDNWLDNYDKLTKSVMVHEILDSIYKQDNTYKVNCLMQNVDKIQDIMRENGFYIPKSEGVLPKKKYAETLINLNQ